MNGSAFDPGAAGRDAAPAPVFERIAFVGIGVVNGSLARDARRLGLAERLVAAARRRETLDQALALGLVDEAAPDPSAAVRGADLVVLGVPVGAVGEAARAVAGSLRPDAVVTDVGPVKARVLDLVSPHLDMRRFVPGHPITSAEGSGPQAAVEHLFRDRWCILTPRADTDPAAVERVAALWRAVGSKVETMAAAQHDRVLAAVSHLPHLLAFNAVNTAGDVEHALRGEVLKYAAGGVGDFNRVAGADPAVWRDVFLHNRAAMLEIVGRYVENLAALQRAIRRGEADALYERFASARAIHRGEARPGDSPSPGMW